jgi:hypothetical protein
MTVDHYLLSLYLDHGYNAHCYLMCKGNRVQHATNKLFAELDRLKIEVRLPIVMVSRLSESIDLVRDIVGKNPDAKRTMQAATDFHMSMWLEPADSADDQKLMKLH